MTCLAHAKAGSRWSYNIRTQPLCCMLLYFSYTTYHTPSNTKSFEQHFCVRNNSGNMVVYTYMLVYWPTALLLMLHYHRRCGSGATLLRFLLGVTHGPPLFSSFLFCLFYYDGKIARSLRLPVSAGNIKTTALLLLLEPAPPCLCRLRP